MEIRKLREQQVRLERVAARLVRRFGVQALYLSLEEVESVDCRLEQLTAPWWRSLTEWTYRFRVGRAVRLWLQRRANGDITWPPLH